MALVVELALCPRLWTADRNFPTVPVAPWLGSLSNLVTLALTTCLVASLGIVALAPKPGWLCLVPPLVGAVLVGADINRLQPWFYQYSALLLALALVKWDDENAPGSRAAWGACACIVAGVYIWSGAQKFNMVFAHSIFPFLVQPLGGAVSRALEPYWVVAPITEMGVGLGLFFPRTRKLGVAAAIAMHGFNLLSLGPLGHAYNSTVWPWNVFVAVIACLLFYGNLGDRVAWARLRPGALILAVAFLLLPALNFAGRWDGFLSSSYYSGRLRDGWIYMTPEAAAALPSGYKQYERAFTKVGPDVFRLDITEWAMSSMNVPPYAKPRMYKHLARQIVQQGVPRSRMTLIVRDQAALTSDDRTYSEVQDW